MSFNELMQQAIKIRTETDAKLRVDFDARAKFQQTSLFATEEVRQGRKLPFEGRISVSVELKNKGNEQFLAAQVTEACHTYEQALAVLWYIENRDPNWKNSGIKDEDLVEVNYSAEEGSEQERLEVRDLKVSLLLNIARAYYKLGDCSTSSEACTQALATDPSCAKALYCRAQASVTPASSGAYEADKAIR
ncbi:unnamed protein product [Choristocarpus tenellus]